MKVSLNLAQVYSTADLTSIPRPSLLARIGEQLGAVEEVKDWGSQFDGAVVVRVVSCEKHPDADKLSVCMVDDGSEQHTQVVCGAPNVRADMYAVWLKPGVTVPSTRDKEPFVLEAREIRGKLSNGMLASAAELGISEDHNGILEVIASEIGRDPVPGEPLVGLFGLDDFVIDCENKMFTHRPDCFGNLGVARELAGISGLKFSSPEWYLKIPEFKEVHDLELTVSNSVEELVPRFMTVVMSDIAVKPSPVWLQATLVRVGIKPINNVVDVTNFVMHLTGQPLHAFDYDKLASRSKMPTLLPRKSVKGEKLTLLGNKEIELTGEELVIATDTQAVALAGVMGGADTEVDTNTKRIVIECATFNMYNIRRTSMRFGLFTDAVTRFTKGQSPLQNDRVISYAMQLMNEHASAVQASNVVDLRAVSEGVYNSQSLYGEIAIDPSFINARLGSDLGAEQMCQLLQNVECAAYAGDDGKIRVTAPFWRTDIEIAEDVVEEVGRLYGYNRLPVTLPRRSARPITKNQLLEYKQAIRRTLRQYGANEVLTYTFVHGDLLKKAKIDAAKWAFHVRNALSPDLQYYRPALLPSLLAKVHANIKAQAGDDTNRFALFELGKVHVTEHTENGLPKPMERLALVFAADDKTAKARLGGAAYYEAKAFLDSLSTGQLQYQPLEDTGYPITAPYARGRSAIVSIAGEVFGVIGEFDQSVSAALKLPLHSAGFEVDVEVLARLGEPSTYKALPNFPQTTQDITIESVTSYAETRRELEVRLKAASEAHGYEWHVEATDIFKQDTAAPTKTTFRVRLWHRDRTLTTDETNTVMETLHKAGMGM